MEVKLILSHTTIHLSLVVMFFFFQFSNSVSLASLWFFGTLDSLIHKNIHFQNWRSSTFRATSSAPLAVCHRDVGGCVVDIAAWSTCGQEAELDEGRVGSACFTHEEVPCQRKNATVHINHRGWFGVFRCCELIRGWFGVQDWMIVFDIDDFNLVHHHFWSIVQACPSTQTN